MSALTGTSKLALTLAAAPAVIGAALFWLGLSAAGGASWAAITAAVLLFALAVAMLLRAAVIWLRRRRVKSKLTSYACPACGYAPSLRDIEKGGSFPCPKCSQPIYPK